jgi:hypothetical protein
VCGVWFHEENGCHLVDLEHVRTCGRKECTVKMLKLALLRDEIEQGFRTEELSSD